MMGIGIPELLIVLVVVLIIFGPKRLPMLGRQLGGGMREFKNSITSKADDADEPEAEPDDAANRPALARTPPVDPPDPTPDATRAPAGDRDATATRPGP